MASVEPRFNEAIHAPLRLRICGLLRTVEELDFSVLRETLGISDANLSKHLKVLTDLGFVDMSKRPSADRTDSRRLTWVRLTRSGRRAFDAHVQELTRIAAGFAGTTASE